MPSRGTAAAVGPICDSFSSVVRRPRRSVARVSKLSDASQKGSDEMLACDTQGLGTPHTSGSQDSGTHEERTGHSGADEHMSERDGQSQG